MENLQFPWCIYAELQTKAKPCGRVTSRSWGIENGLNNFLKAVESGSFPQNQEEFQRDVDRAVATGSWVERNHTRLRHKYMHPETNHAERHILACVSLSDNRRILSAEEWRLLSAVAAGVAYSEITGKKVGSVRTKVARLRARLRSEGKVRPYSAAIEAII